MVWEKLETCFWKLLQRKVRWSKQLAHEEEPSSKCILEVITIYDMLCLP
jgi:hypothetical protein